MPLVRSGPKRKNFLIIFTIMSATSLAVIPSTDLPFISNISSSIQRAAWKSLKSQHISSGSVLINTDQVIILNINFTCYTKVYINKSYFSNLDRDGRLPEKHLRLITGGQLDCHELCICSWRDHETDSVFCNLCFVSL